MCIYIFYAADLQDDPPISKNVATLEIKHTSLVLNSRINTLIMKCLFAAVKRATERPEKQLPAIVRRWVITCTNNIYYNISYILSDILIMVYTVLIVHQL
jgi:hemoglobin-like flavoprotein